MKSFKNFISVLLVLTLIVSIVACKDNSEKTVSKEEGLEVQEEAVQKKLDLTLWWAHGSTVPPLEKPHENIPGDWLEEKTGVHLTEVFGNEGNDPTVKLGLMIAGNTLPDIAISRNLSGIDKAVEGDLIYEITPEMIEKYCPNITARMPDYTWEGPKFGDKIYGVPSDVAQHYLRFVEGKSDDWYDYFGKAYNSINSYHFAVRDDILKEIFPEAMNFAEATNYLEENNRKMADKFILPIDTTEEYVDFLYKIKELNLEVDNKPVYAFGYPVGDNWVALTAFGGELMGYKGYNYLSMYNAVEDRFQVGLTTDIVKNAAKLQSQLVRDKVFDPESLVHTMEVFKEKVFRGQYAILPVMNFGGIGIKDDYEGINIEMEKQGKDFRYVPLNTQIKNVPEHPYYVPTPVRGGAGYNIMIFKTVAEEDVPQVLNWIDTQFTEEWDQVRHWGPEEAGLYEELPDGKRKFKDELLQKAIVEKDTSIDWKDCKGLYRYNRPTNLPEEIIRPYPSEWTPAFMYRDTETLRIKKAFKEVPYTSEYAQGLLEIPEIKVWKPNYKVITEVQTMLNTREVWEDPFKVTLVSESEEDFEEKWAQALEIFHTNVDAKIIEDMQYEIFKEDYEVVKSRKK